MIHPFEAPIYVTRPTLPSFDRFARQLQSVWHTKQLTNNGPLVQRLERVLASSMNQERVSVVANGTLALQLALKASGIKNEVITSPFTFVATAHSIVWNGCVPVFVDILPEAQTIDPEAVERAITPRTTAIVGVHVYGRPCEHPELKSIADRHGLRLLYDAAHAFGVHVDGKCISHLGNLSVFSFHATKAFHSLEGGMVTARDQDMITKINYLRNFGFESETEVVTVGTNAKMNEIQAAIGLLSLRSFGDEVRNRMRIHEAYLNHLSEVPGLSLPPELPDRVDSNYSYFPVLVDHHRFGLSRDELFERLKAYNVFARRYFYPLLPDLRSYSSSTVRGDLSVAREVASQVLCLPIYGELEPEIAKRICEIVREIQRTV